MLKVQYHLASHTTRQLGLTLMLICVCTKIRAYIQPGNLKASTYHGAFPIERAQIT